MRLEKHIRYNPAPGVAYEDAFTEVSDEKLIIEKV